MPFAIQDRTPLSYRVAPSASVAGGPLMGVGQVIVAVEELDAAVETFRDLYRFPKPVRESVSGFGTVVSFPGHPLGLATPDGTDWFADRVAELGTGPACACS